MHKHIRVNICINMTMQFLSLPLAREFSLFVSVPHDPGRLDSILNVCALFSY
jgi:hypothetical protein